MTLSGTRLSRSSHTALSENAVTIAIDVRDVHAATAVAIVTDAQNAKLGQFLEDQVSVRWRRRRLVWTRPPEQLNDLLSLYEHMLPPEVLETFHRRILFTYLFDW